MWYWTERRMNKWSMVKVMWQKAALSPHMDGIPYTLQWAVSSTLKLPLCIGESGSHLIYGSLGPTRVHNPKGISVQLFL